MSRLERSIGSRLRSDGVRRFEGIGGIDWIKGIQRLIPSEFWSVHGLSTPIRSLVRD